MAAGRRRAAGGADRPHHAVSQHLDRPSFGYGVAAMGSLPPESLATVLFGNVFGSLRWTYDYWGPDWHSLSEGTWTDRATNYSSSARSRPCSSSGTAIAGGRLFAREFRFFLVFGLPGAPLRAGALHPGLRRRLRLFSRRQPLSPPRGRDLPHQHRPGLRRRLSGAPLRDPRVAALDPSRARPAGRAACHSRHWLLASAAIARRPRLRAAGGPAPARPCARSPSACAFARPPSG